MKKGRVLPYVAAVGAATGLLILTQLKLDFHWHSQAEAQAPAAPASPSVASAGPPPPAAGPVAAAPTFAEPARELTLLERIERESARIGTVTESPAEVERHLDAWAARLGLSEITELRRMVLAGEGEGDEIALALDLLGRSNSPEAQVALVEYVLQGAAVSSREEGTFQLLALEGIVDQTGRTGSTVALRRIQRESKDPFVSRRAAQALGAFAGRNPWPKETDEKALAELLESSSR